MNVRLYNSEDFPLLKQWWGSNEASPIEEMLPETTFILEVDGKPAVSAALFLTNCRYAAWVEHLVADPELNPSTRHLAVDRMFNFLEVEAKNRGYKAVCLFSYVEKLKLRYESLGFVPTKSNVTTFAKLI